MIARTVTALCIALFGAGLAHSQATVKPDGQWRAVIGLGASASSGNTTSTNVSLTGDAVRATDQDKLTAYANALYARSEGVTTGEQMRLGGRYDYNLNADWFGFGGLDFERNKLSNIKLRSMGTVGLGYHAIKTPQTVWDLFAGVGYTADSYTEPTLIDGATRTSYGYPSLLLAQESTHKLSESTSAKQRLAVYPNLRNTGEYRATWDAGLAVAMSKTMNLTVGLGVSYNSEPGVGRKTTDTLLTTGVSVRFD